MQAHFKVIYLNGMFQWLKICHTCLVMLIRFQVIYPSGKLTVTVNHELLSMTHISPRYCSDCRGLLCALAGLCSILLE
jgi:hypothetical protein